MVCTLNVPDYTWPSSDEHSLFQLLRLVEDALYLDAPSALKHLQRAIASRLNGNRAPELQRVGHELQRVGHEDAILEARCAEQALSQEIVRAPGEPYAVTQAMSRELSDIVCER